MDMIYWFYELAEGAFRLQVTFDPSFNVNYDPNIPKAITFGVILGAGIIGTIIMALIFRPLRLGFLGSVFFGLLGGCLGAYLFLSTVYNIVPNETTLFDFDNNLNIDFLTGLIVGGFLGGFLVTFILGLLKNLVFSNRAAA